MLKEIAKLLIKIYQKLFSFDHSFWAPWVGMPMCRFHPTCSEYTYEAIDKYGVFKGSFLGFKRILRCNPWTKGGYDPVI